MSEAHTMHRHAADDRAAQAGRAPRQERPSDAQAVRWRLRGKSGEGEPGTLRLQAPKTPGRYKLFVTANGHSKVALVVVSK